MSSILSLLTLAPFSLIHKSYPTEYQNLACFLRKMIKNAKNLISISTKRIAIMLFL